MTLENRVAVIAGAMGVLGSLAAHRLAEQGARLVLIDREADKLENLEKELNLPADRLVHYKVDLLDPKATSAVAETAAARFGHLDILLHLVGGWTGGKTLIESTDENLAFMINQHIWSGFNVIRAFIPHLVKNGWGRVIMITSPFASRPRPEGGPFAIGKAGQEALMLALSEELRGTGVTANLLQVKTIDAKREKVTIPSPKSVSWTTPEELAAAILFLLSDEAGTINGAKIPLYGSY
jgi:NAD(P)-dependent dehydrogenase (short-subunit alcohol dehydrogenase family)